MTPDASEAAPDPTEGDVNTGSFREAWQSDHLDETTRALLDDDARYFLHQALSTPCLNAIESAQGTILIDLQGREIIDFHGNSAHQVGYGHTKVLQAVRKQMETLSFSPRRYTNRPAVDLAKRLCEAAPMQDARVLFAPGGAATIGMALKLARLATGRFKTISWWDSFHGASLEAIGVGGEAMFRKNAGPLLPGAVHIPPPGARMGDRIIAPEESLDHINYVMEHEGDVGAFIAEPIRCTQVIQPPAFYWEGVRECCERHGALLIFDEIPIGLGRVGTLFACEYANIQPDIVCLGKGLGGGLFPMAAMLARGDLNVAAESSIGHFTHEKSPVGAAAALAVLDVLDEEGLLERANRLGAATEDRLRSIGSNCSHIREIRRAGFLLGVEMNEARDAEAMLYACLRRGLSFKVSGGTVLTLAPPLTISESVLDQAMTIMEESFAELAGNSETNEG